MRAIVPILLGLDRPSLIQSHCSTAAHRVGLLAKRSPDSLGTPIDKLGVPKQQEKRHPLPREPAPEDAGSSNSPCPAFETLRTPDMFERLVNRAICLPTSVPNLVFYGHWASTFGGETTPRRRRPP